MPDGTAFLIGPPRAGAQGVSECAAWISGRSVHKRLTFVMTDAPDPSAQGFFQGI
jgi:hypothetical protein